MSDSAFPSSLPSAPSMLFNLSLWLCLSLSFQFLSQKEKLQAWQVVPKQIDKSKIF